jgi:uncharacterized phage-like protein YoqJ
MDPNITCCFTGHRPEKLPWRMNETDPRCQRLKSWIDFELREAYQSGYRHFLCGMAQGCDLYFCEAVLSLRDKCPDVFLEAAIPCPDQANHWDSQQRRRYDQLLLRCDKTTLVSPIRTPGCMMLRNRYMVDRSTRLIAAFDGTKGGTMNTVAYAKKRNLEIHRLDPSTL